MPSISAPWDVSQPTNYMVVAPNGDHTGPCKQKPCYCETVYVRPMTDEERKKYNGG